MEIKRFKLENIKKEYYLPLAIIISTIVIAIAIYLGTTSEFRHKKAACEDLYGEQLKKVPKSTIKLILQECISKFDK